MKPKISVVIPTYNCGHILPRTLPTILAQDFPADAYEVIVVVDGSTDDTIELLRGFRPACALRVVEQPNRGLAAARNGGLREAEAPLVLFLDDDMLCDAALVRRHLAAHDPQEPLVVYGPLPIAPASPNTLATDRMRIACEALVGRLTRGLELRWPSELWLGSNWSIPRATILAAGGYDESFFFGHEDLELGIRLWKTGLRFRCEPAALAFHLYVKSARAVWRDASRYGRSEVLLSRKHPEYKPYAWLAQLTEGPSQKRWMRQLLVRLPISLEPLLTPIIWIVERLRWIPMVRRAGVRLLEGWRSVAVLRAALREAGSWEALRKEFG